MDLLADLTEAQREAVTHIDGPLLVLAGAGSGKTRVITRRVAHLLGSGIPSDQVLALTFTNKAAGEMRERIEALVPRSRVWVGTFHAFCARMLRRYSTLVGIDSGFSIYDQSDRLRVVKEVMEELGWDEAGWTGERVESTISRAKNDLVGPQAMARRESDCPWRKIARVYQLYEDRLKRASAVDFDDLLVHMVAIVKEHRDVRAALDRQFRYVLVDEYQDTNLAQYAIVRALSADHPNICVTGDPDQSIYGWRGANISNILDFEKDFPGCKVVTLERNYRSTKNIIGVADHLIRFNRRRKPKALRTENPVGEPVDLTIYQRDIDEADGIAGKIVSLVRDGEFSFADIAVFCRVTSLTRAFEQSFRSAGIPHQIVGGVGFYERQEIKDVLAYLSLLVNPKDDVALARVVNVPPRGVGKVSIDHLAAAARDRGIPLLAMAHQAPFVAALKGKAAAAFLDFAHLMDELAALRDRPAAEVVAELVEKTGYREHLKAGSRDKDADRLDNLDELITAARQFDDEHAGASVQDFLADITLASPIDRWDEQSGKVTLMTVHAAKGLEFPVVFIVALEQGLLPHSRAKDNESETEEERRLLFVGITRARRKLFLSRSVIRTFQGKQQATLPSSFLRELPEGPIEVRDLSGLGGGSFLASYQSAGSRPTYRGESSAAPPPGQFRMTTAAQLAGASERMGDSWGVPSPAELAAMQPGTAVLHPQFGLGRIVAIEGEGTRRKGRVAFAFGAPRVFMLAQAPLRPVNKNGSGGVLDRGTTLGDPT
jgi:DNA helicase-2/ATP-dependent DNA helicase PcrA